jgi:hypothetical protein
VCRDNWAKHESPNKNVKIYIGAAGSADSAGQGYVPIDTLIHVAQDAQKRYSSFGGWSLFWRRNEAHSRCIDTGVMIWDASSSFCNSSCGSFVAYMTLTTERLWRTANGRYDAAIKKALVSGAKRLTAASRTPSHNAMSQEL